MIEDGEAYGYYREEGGGLLVGMFEPVGKAWALDGTPRDSAFAVLPPDWDRMAPFLEVAMRRFPALEDAGIRTLFCGPESFTDDLSPMLGESPEVSNLYLACGLNSVGILSGGGLGHMMAQWLIEEHPPLDVTAVGVDRTHEFQATRRFREERTVERLGFLLNDRRLAERSTEPARNVRQSPYHAQHVDDGAHFVATNGWEFPEYFAGPGVTPTVEWGFARGEALRAHARGAPPRAGQLGDLRPVLDVALPGAGSARDGRCSTGSAPTTSTSRSVGSSTRSGSTSAAGSSPTSRSRGWPRTPTW